MSGNREALAVKSIQALRRGLDVLDAIESNSATTLADLHRRTGLAKASLLRILKTLEQAGRVHYSEADGRYWPAIRSTDPSQEKKGESALARLAAPICHELQRRVPWPIDLAVRDGDAMLILDTHRPASGLSVNYRALGFRPPMLISSLGRCYLAFCPPAERDEIFAALAHSPRPADREALRPARVRRLLSDARALGYATRDPSPTRLDSPDRFGAVSVPVHCDGRVLACLSLAWPSQVVGEHQIVKAHLGDLLQAARAVEARLVQAGMRHPLA